MPYFVYLLKCLDGTYYCGYSRNVDARVKAHNSGRGAKYTRARRPVKLVYSERKRTLGTALRREAEIKKMGRERKARLIAGAS